MADAERTGEIVADWPAASEPGPGGPYAGLSRDGVHLLRTTQQIQYQLSQMADQKASMLLGITFVIFTLALGQSRSGPPTVPVMILGAAAFLAAMLSVLAVLPSAGGFASKPAASPNILFFGVFSKMSEAEFVETLLARTADDQAVYATFARDIYQNGKVLAGKKYRLLGWAYRILLAGLFASAAAFVIPLIARTFGF